MSWTKSEQNIIKAQGDDIKDIKVALMGEPKDTDSTGLIGDVHANTRFRKSISKKVNAVGVVLSGLVSKVIYSWWIKEGGN